VVVSTDWLKHSGVPSFCQLYGRDSCALRSQRETTLGFRRCCTSGSNFSGDNATNEESWASKTAQPLARREFYLLAADQDLIGRQLVSTTLGKASNHSSRSMGTEAKLMHRWNIIIRTPRSIPLLIGTVILVYASVDRHSIGGSCSNACSLSLCCCRVRSRPPKTMQPTDTTAILAAGVAQSQSAIDRALQPRLPRSARPTAP
jgi:hypothetical protein